MDTSTPSAPRPVAGPHSIRKGGVLMEFDPDPTLTKLWRIWCPYCPMTTRVEKQRQAKRRLAQHLEKSHTTSQTELF